MTYRAIYAYAWDVAERGVGDFVAEAKALGLDTVSLAGSYHAGKFITGVVLPVDCGLTAGNIVMARELTLEDF